MAGVSEIASVIFAAGRGSRMAGFDGNKTLLSLTPGHPGEQEHLILREIIRHLPGGPKAVVVNFRKQDIVAATGDLQPTYCEQPELNGTGGALLAARTFLERIPCSRIIITMGDVPLVRPQTYRMLAEQLAHQSFVVLGFRPRSRKKYGLLQIKGDQVRRIVEWEYWRTFPANRKAGLTVCNSGIYAVRRLDLLHYLPALAAKPHRVTKLIHGREQKVEEFFITDLIEIMSADGLPVGYRVVEDETELLGVDDRSSLERARELFQSR